MQAEPNKRSWQFSIRDVLLLMLVVGLAVGWIVDHHRLADELQRQRSQNNWSTNIGLTTALPFLNGTLGNTSPVPLTPVEPDERITDPPPPVKPDERITDPPPVNVIP